MITTEKPCHPASRIFYAAMVVATLGDGQRAVAGQANDSPIRLQPGVRQLFMDDVGIERLDGLRRVVNSPTRHPRNPLLKPDKPWERGCQVYGTAMFDQQANLFRMWYLTGLKEDRGLKPLVVDGVERPPHSTLVGYAESLDGIVWEKPNLGVFPVDGDKNNNLVGMGKYNCEGVSVLYEPHDANPQRRWKALFWDHGSGGWHLVDGKPRTKNGPEDGVWIAFSPDGIHWTNYENIPVIIGYSDTNQVLLYDDLDIPRRGRRQNRHAAGRQS